MSKELNCMNCCIGDFKRSLCDCNNGMCKEYKKVGRAEDFENEVLNRTKPKTGWIPVSEMRKLQDILYLHIDSLEGTRNIVEAGMLSAWKEVAEYIDGMLGEDGIEE